MSTLAFAIAVAIDWRAMWVPTWSPLEVVLRASAVYTVVQILFRYIGSKELGRYATHELAMVTLITVAARQAIVGPDVSLTSAIVGLITVATLEWLLSYLSFRSQRSLGIARASST